MATIQHRHPRRVSHRASRAIHLGAGALQHLPSQSHGSLEPRGQALPDALHRIRLGRAGPLHVDQAKQLHLRVELTRPPQLERPDHPPRQRHEPGRLAALDAPASHVGDAPRDGEE